jgi:hypothetical protein
VRHTSSNVSITCAFSFQILYLERGGRHISKNMVPSPSAAVRTSHKRQVATITILGNYLKHSCSSFDGKLFFRPYDNGMLGGRLRGKGTLWYMFIAQAISRLVERIPNAYLVQCDCRTIVGQESVCSQIRNG